MKISRSFLKRALVATASFMQAKRMLAERDAPSIETPPSPSLPASEARLLGGPYRGPTARPSCTSCNDAVVPWCVLCGRPIELGEPLFCPSKKLTLDELGDVRIHDGTASLYEIAAPKEHTHQKCAFAHAASLLIHAITKNAI